MSCPECSGTGFIHKRIGYRSKFSGRMHPKTLVAARCPNYTQYFESVVDLLSSSVIWNDQVCSAASQRHDDIQRQAAARDKDKGTGRGPKTR